MRIGKIYALVFLISLLTLSSCMLLLPEANEFYSQYGNDDELRELIFEKILTAFEEKDVEAMEGLFSTYAKTKTLNLSDKIQKAFDFYEGEVMSYEGNHGLSRRSGPDGHDENIDGSYLVVTDKNIYCIAFAYCSINSIERSKIGLHALQIVEESFVEPGRFFCVDLDHKPGVYIQRSALTDEELEERNRRFRQ